jgi:S-adenosylmethionine decarboxylase
MGGLHIISEFFGCKNSELLKNREELEKKLSGIVDGNGLTVVGTYFYQFGEGNGVTGVVVLAESHVSVHTWPEKENFINADVFVCNVTQDNTDKAKAVYEDIKELFAPEKEETQEIMRK